MSGRWWRWPVLGVVGVTLVGAGFWAGRTAMAPASVPTDLPASEVLVEVTVQTVGRTLNLGVTVEQPKRVLSVNALTGVVTGVGESEAVDVGDTLYSVVRAVQGSLPFYRELSYRTTGKDVQQLRNALVELGYLEAKGSVFDYATRSAVRAWQKDLGMPRTGTIALGELVAVPKLPVALLLDDKVIAKGGVLAGGEKIVYGATGEPAFTLVLSEEQARLIPGSATIAMEYEGKHWDAVVARTETGENNDVTMHLAAADGGAVCGADCDLVANGSALNILSEVAVVPPATGPAVPVASITTNADGTTSVVAVDDAGARAPRTVTVLGSQNGVAVVDGVAPGETVQVLAASPVPNSTDGAAEPSPEPSK